MYSLKKVSDIDEIVNTSKGTKWDIQDPHYAEMYAPITFIFKDGVRYLAFNGEYWGDVNDARIEPANVTDEQLRSLMQDGARMPFTGSYPQLKTPTKYPQSRGKDVGWGGAHRPHSFSDAWDEDVNKIANMLTDDPDVFND